MHQNVLLCLALLAWGGAAGATACERFTLTSPARFDTVDTLQPVLRWSGAASQTYRVQVAALLPEARVVMALDTEVTGNSFRVPAPLPVERAGVKVLVSRGCPQQDAQDLQAQGAWFFVDRRAHCELDRASLAQTALGVSWQAVSGATGYSVRLFAAAADGALQSVREQEVGGTSWAVPGALQAHQVVSVHALCNGLPGPPAALLLKPAAQ